MKKKSAFLLFLGISLFINLLFVSIFRFKTMSPNWTGPYYSAAANLKFGGNFVVCPDQIYEFKRLDNVKFEDKYKFGKCDSPIFYNSNPVGFAYIIWAASHLFPFFGQQQALICLQVFLFFILCLIILKDKAIPDLFKWFFIFLFMFNPFVIRFTDFNFYYFWQIFPAFLIILYFFKHKLEWYYLFPFLFIIGLVVTFRPTLILIAGILLFQVFRNEKFSKAMLAITFFLLPFLFAFKPSDKNFFHTAYVGIGAYSNPWGIKLSDDDGYDLYEKVRGIQLNSSFGGNYYNDSVIKDYSLVTKEAYFSMLKEKPELFVKNAVLNTLLSFSTGYITELPMRLHYLLALLGLMHIILLIYLRKWYIILLILGSVGTVVLYYPPIPAYIFCNYLILTLSLYCIIHELKLKGRLPFFQRFNGLAVCKNGNQ